MTREEYLILRNENRHNEIMYNYAVDKGFKYSLNDYQSYMMHWSQRVHPEEMNIIHMNVLLHYDILFGVTTAQKEHTVTEKNMMGENVEVTRITILKII